MTDKELINILENGGAISVPYFDGAMIKVNADRHLTTAEQLPALKNFLGLSAENRQSDARHHVAYCKMMMDAVGEEEILEDMNGEQPTVENIWSHVKIRHIFFGWLDAGKYAAKRTIYLQVEGEVTWEPEHGLQMSWAEGRRLVKSGPFDGHPTNGHASAKPEDDQYVFGCYQPEHCTLPDPE